MQDEKKLELLLERFYNRYNKYNTKVLQKMGETIKKFNGITPSVAHKIAQELKYSTDIDELLNELNKLNKLSIEDIKSALEIVAQDNLSILKATKDKNIEKIVTAMAKETSETFKNLSKTRAVGFVLKEKGKTKFKSLKKTYRDLIDEAVYNVEIGVENYQSAMRNVMKQLSDSGVKIHEENIAYESGYNRRIDSAVRENVLTGVRKLNIDIQEQIGQQYDADGIEISAHSDCAEDHLHIQGKQFSKKEFNKINGSLERPIGEYNCRHFIFAIVLGVNQPSYTQKQLNQMNQESVKKVTYEGKTYTKYEATQVQRQLETAIRKQKDRQIIAKASNDKEEIGLAQQKINQLTIKYNDFSKKVGLDTYKNRLTVSGYQRVAIKK